jgi:hypothetical protein
LGYEPYSGFHAIVQVRSWNQLMERQEAKINALLCFSVCLYCDQLSLLVLMN